MYNFYQIVNHMTLDELLLEKDSTMYDSYTVPDDTVILIKDDLDERYHQVEYVQVFINEVGNREAIFQLDGVREDPAKYELNDDIDCRIYKQINC